jgi:hypothetical protein
MFGQTGGALSCAHPLERYGGDLQSVIGFVRRFVAAFGGMAEFASGVWGAWLYLAALCVMFAVLGWVFQKRFEAACKPSDSDSYTEYVHKGVDNI